MSVVEVKFSKYELKTLVKSSDTRVSVERKTRVLYVNPAQFYNLSTGIQESLDSLLLKYDFLFKAIILGYNKIKLLSKYGSFCYRSSKVSLQIEADFYLFNPAVGSKLQGVVCKRSGHHLGCLVHKAFNVFIPISEDDYNTGWDFSIGQEVQFKVISLDLTSGPLPYIKGQLVNEESEGADGDANGSLIGTDSGISYGHEDELGEYDSGVATSSGKDTAESEDTEKDDGSRHLIEESTRKSGMSTKSPAKKKKSRKKAGDEMEKELLKSIEMSSEEEAEASKRDVLDSAGALPDEVIKSLLITTEMSFEEKEGELSKKGLNKEEFESLSEDKGKTEGTNAVKKRKSILKNKKEEDPSSSNEEMIKSQLKTMEASFDKKEAEVSKVLDKAVVKSSHRKDVAKSKVVEDEEKSKNIVPEVNKKAITPSPSTKKRKSILKSKKEDPSLSSEEMIKALLKNMEMSFEEDKGNVSIKGGVKSGEILSPRKDAVEREVTMTNESRQITPESIVASSPKTATKKRKSILKNKKDLPPQYEELAKRLMKTVGMSCEEETGTSRKEEANKPIQTGDEQKAVTTQDNKSPVKSICRSSLDTALKESVKKSRKSNTNTLPILEEAKISSPMEPLGKSNDSDKISLSSTTVESTNKAEKPVEAKVNILDTTEPVHGSPNKKGEGEEKKKKRKSVSNVTPKAESEIEKLLALNQKLLRIVPLENDEVGESKGDKGDKLASEEKKKKKRKRESKDVSESPQRKKVARRLSENSNVSGLVSSS